jgi:hypothetical protein
MNRAPTHPGRLIVPEFEHLTLDDRIALAERRCAAIPDRPLPDRRYQDAAVFAAFSVLALVWRIERTASEILAHSGAAHARQIIALHRRAVTAARPILKQVGAVADPCATRCNAETDDADAA